MRDARGQGIARARAQAPVGPRVQPAPGQSRLDVPAGEGHEVAAVADHDCVVGQAGEELSVDARRMDGVGITGEIRGIGCDRGEVPCPQALGPVRCAHRFGQQPGEQRALTGEVARAGCGEVEVRGELALGVGKVHHARAAVAEPAVAEPEVQRGPDHCHHVGGGKRCTACARHEQGMIGRQDAAGHPVGDDGDASDVGEQSRGVLRALGPDVAAEDEDGALGGAQDCGHRVEFTRIGSAGLRACGHGNRRRGREEHVHRDVDEHRPPVRRAGVGERLVDRHADTGRIAHGPGTLGHRLEDRHVVEFLQRAAAPAPLRRASPDEDEGRAVDEGAGHGADRVGDTGTGRDHREPRRAGELARGLRGEDRGLLVAHVDEPQRPVLAGTAPHRGVVQGEHVRARQREHRPYAVAQGGVHRLGTPVLRCWIHDAAYRSVSVSTPIPIATSARIAPTVMSVLFCTRAPFECR